MAKSGASHDECVTVSAECHLIRKKNNNMKLHMQTICIKAINLPWNTIRKTFSLYVVYLIDV